MSFTSHFNLTKVSIKPLPSVHYKSAQTKDINKKYKNNIQQQCVHLQTAAVKPTTDAVYQHCSHITLYC